MRWMTDDIVVGGLVFGHGVNASRQEFYETAITPCKVVLGTFRNHSEKVWIAYAYIGDRWRCLNTATVHPDGTREEGPLYGISGLEPRGLLEGLARLWQEHGAGIVDLKPTLHRPGTKEH